METKIRTGQINKPHRRADPELLAGIRTLPCAACLGPPPSDAHHIRTVGSGGPDEDWNVIPLCRGDHIAWHANARATLFHMRPQLLGVLEHMGWRWDGRRLSHPRAQAGGP